MRTCLKRNRIFIDRTVGVGGITAEKALNYSFSGPNLRAAGVDYDVRVALPYSSYQDFDFIIPIGKHGDVYDRFMVRQEEMWQSMSIIRQAIDKLPEGPFHADVPDFYLPPKEEVYNNMEALIYHFKIVMGETDVPKGEVYHAVEGGNGELGFLSDKRRGTNAVSASLQKTLLYFLSSISGNDKRLNVIRCDFDNEQYECDSGRTGLLGKQGTNK